LSWRKIAKVELIISQLAAGLWITL